MNPIHLLIAFRLDAVLVSILFLMLGLAVRFLPEVWNG